MMKLRTKYILFVVILHLVTLVLSYFIFKDYKILFIGSEVLIITSMVVAWQLYTQLLKPLQLLVEGADAIRDRDFNVKFLATGKYEIDELIKVYNHMIDELRMERTKQEQQHLFLEKLIYTSPTGILVLDYDDNIKEINPRALKILNMEETSLRGRPVAAVTHPLIREIRQISSGKSKMVTLNGLNTYKIQKSHFIDRGFARHFVMIEELTAEILAAEKKAYGKVIRMMAHEVNNTIGPVNSILESTLSSNSLWGDPANETLRQAIRVASDRNDSLNIFMKNFAEVVRLPEPSRKMIDLHLLILNIVHLMEMKAVEKQILFEINVPDTPFFVFADQQQIEHVFINILKNAMDAIGEKGTVTVTSRPGIKQLSITDTGSGIDESTAAQLFTPFFSTKKDGQGIGLTLVKEILLNHGCEFSLKTTHQRTTVFEISFPGQ